MNTVLEQLYWREPLWLLLAFMPLLSFVWQQQQLRRSLRRYADPDLLPWILVPQEQTRRYWQQLLQFIIWLLLAIAASGPRFLLSTPPEIQPPQGSLVIVIDHSRSMQASDVFPDRLQQVHRLINQWFQYESELNSVLASGTKVGLIIFAGASHVVLPPTDDRQILQDTTALLDEIQLPTHGSAIVQALQQAQTLLQDESGDRAILMLTDADISTPQFNQLKLDIPELQKQNISLYLLGAGTPSPIALTDNTGRWLQHDGKTVITRLNESALIQLAKNKDVFYQRLDPDTHSSLGNIWQAKPARIDFQHADTQLLNRIIWDELFPWFLVPALLLIILKHLFSDSVISRITAIAFGLSLSAISLIVSLTPSPAYSTTSIDQDTTLARAYKLWKKQDYSRAALEYARIDGYQARMGEGASCFRDNRIDCAINAFSRAAWIADTDTQRSQAAFNLGNSFFRQGDFKSAITLYRDALRYQPKEKTYLNNLEFSLEVQRNIEMRLQQEAASQRDSSRSNSWKPGQNSQIDFDNTRVSDMNITLDSGDIRNSNTGSENHQLSEEMLAKYMQRHKNFARVKLLKKNRNQRQHDWRRFTNKDPVAARRVEYWQRLFELEEGIPVHPLTPKSLPGIRPW